MQKTKEQYYVQMVELL